MLIFVAKKKLLFLWQMGDRQNHCLSQQSSVRRHTMLLIVTTVNTVRCSEVVIREVQETVNISVVRGYHRSWGLCLLFHGTTCCFKNEKGPLSGRRRR